MRLTKCLCGAVLALCTIISLLPLDSSGGGAAYALSSGDIPSQYRVLTEINGNSDASSKQTLTLYANETYYIELAGGEGGADWYTPGKGGYQILSVTPSANTTVTIYAGGSGKYFKSAYPDGQRAVDSLESGGGRGSGGSSSIWIGTESSKTLLAAAGGGGASGNGRHGGSDQVDTGYSTTYTPHLLATGDNGTGLGLSGTNKVWTSFDTKQGDDRGKDLSFPIVGSGKSTSAYLNTFIDYMLASNSRSLGYDWISFQLYASKYDGGGGGGGFPSGENKNGFVDLAGWYGVLSPYHVTSWESRWIMYGSAGGTGGQGYNYWRATGTSTLSGVKINAYSGSDGTQSGNGYVRIWANFKQLTINPNGGLYKLGSSSYIEKGLKSQSVSVEDPTRLGYSFTGWTFSGGGTWSASGKKYTFGDSDATLTAGWSAVSYTITYNLGGGTNSSSNPSSYTAATPTFTLKNPTRDGYAFIGWTGTGTSSTPGGVTVPLGSTGNRTYTAHWVQLATIPLTGTVNTAYKPYSSTLSGTTISLAKGGVDLDWTAFKAADIASMKVNGYYVYYKLNSSSVYKRYSDTVQSAKTKAFNNATSKDNEVYDGAAPNAVASAKSETASGGIKVIWGQPLDNGTLYDFYVTGINVAYTKPYLEGILIMAGVSETEAAGATLTKLWNTKSWLTAISSNADARNLLKKYNVEQVTAALETNWSQELNTLAYNMGTSFYAVHGGYATSEWSKGTQHFHLHYDGYSSKEELDNGSDPGSRVSQLKACRGIDFSSTPILLNDMQYGNSYSCFDGALPIDNYRGGKIEVSAHGQRTSLDSDNATLDVGFLTGVPSLSDLYYRSDYTNSGVPSGWGYLDSAGRITIHKNNDVSGSASGIIPSSGNLYLGMFAYGKIIWVDSVKISPASALTNAETAPTNLTPDETGNYKSNTVQLSVQTGVYGYIVKVDTSSSTTVNWSTTGAVWVKQASSGDNSYTVASSSATQYLHIAAVDKAGNVGATTHVMIRPATYTVVYNAPDKTSGAMNNDIFGVGIKQALSANAYARKGYKFDGWSINANARSQLSYVDKAEVIDIAKPGQTLNLYARWLPITYYISFNRTAGDSGDISNQSFVYDTASTLKSQLYSKTGYTQRGWTTVVKGSNGVVSNDAYRGMMSEIIHGGLSITNWADTDGQVIPLYALWTPNVYVLKFKFNEQSNWTHDMVIADGNWVTDIDAEHKQDEKEVTYDSKIGNIVKPTVVGWTLDGWKIDGTSDMITEDTVWKYTSDKTAIAQWRAHKYTIVYDKNKPSNATHEVQGSMPTPTHVYDTPKPLDKNKYTLTGWIWHGWSLTPGGDVAFADEASVANLTSADGGTVTLYAVWKPIEYDVYIWDNVPSVYSGSFARGSISGWTKGDDGYYIHCVYDKAFVIPSPSSLYTLTGWDSSPAYYQFDRQMTEVELIEPSVLDDMHKDSGSSRFVGTNYHGGVKCSDCSLTQMSGSAKWNLTTEDGGEVHLYPYFVPHTYSVEYSGEDAHKGVYDDDRAQ